MKVFECLDPLFLPHLGCNLRLDLSVGEVLVLVGENGIGKSTLLQRFFNSLPIESAVLVEQKNSEYFYDRKLGKLKQLILESGLPELNQEEFLYLWNLFGLSVKEGRLTSHLSGGESQILKLCLALCKNCEFYLLDEASQYLDSERKILLLSYLEKLKHKGKSLILVEHDLSWLPQGWRTQSLVIEEGRLSKGKEWTI